MNVDAPGRIRRAFSKATCALAAFLGHATRTVIFCALAVGAPVLGCGPFLPNSILQDGDEALLRAYFSSFHLELGRIRLPAPEFKAVVSEHGYASATFDAELAGLREALAHAGAASPTAEQIFQQFQAARETLRVHAQAVQDWNQRKAFYGVEDSAPARPTMTAVAAPEGLPDEFQDYLEGSVAFYSDNLNAARAAWERLLARPPGERPHRSTWAAYMLGRISLDFDPDRAIACFQQTRALAKGGFKDSLGLAAASYGWEAKVELARGRVGTAIRLYLIQNQTGDPTALNSLRMVLRKLMEPPREGLMSLAQDTLTQQVVTAYIISMRSFSYLDSTEDTNGVIEQWLEAVEQAGAENVTSADRLALAAYQRDLFEVAERWLARANPDLALVKWLKAKLLLRAGNVAEAAKLLAQVVRLFPKEGEPIPPIRGEGWDADSPLRSAMGELGVLRLARRQYYEALDVLLSSGHWLDAAYIAENVLTPDELAAYVERQWPEPEPELPLPRNAFEPGFEWGFRFDSEGELLPEQTLPRIRYLTARRLARLQRWDEAMVFFPAHWGQRLAAYVDALQRGRNLGNSSEVRAQSLWEAAQIARHEGMELFGTEVEPDWTLFDGQYDLFAISAVRRVRPEEASEERWRPEIKLAASTADEQRRAADHQSEPNLRFHYRYLAADLAWEAAALMPNDSEQTALVLWTAGTWLKVRDPQAADRFYKALVRRCGQTPLGQEADRLRWFPKSPHVPPPAPPVLEQTVSDLDADEHLWLDEELLPSEDLPIEEELPIDGEVPPNGEELSEDDLLPEEELLLEEELPPDWDPLPDAEAPPE